MATLELKHPNGYVFGRAVSKPDGWYFYPNIVGRSPSRKGHPTAEACLPDWAQKRLQQGCTFLAKSTATINRHDLWQLSDAELYGLIKQQHLYAGEAAWELQRRDLEAHSPPGERHR